MASFSASRFAILRAKSGGGSDAMAGARKRPNDKMKRMQKSLRGYGLILAAVWVAFCIAAFLYAQLHNIPTRIVVAVLPAFFVEIALYLAAGIEHVHRRIEGLARPAMLAAAMTASAAVPYCIVALGTGSFQTRSLVTLIVLAGFASFWYLFAGSGTLA